MTAHTYNPHEPPLSYTPATTHSPSTAYTQGLPTPPRVVIPPPNIPSDPSAPHPFTTPSPLLAADSILPISMQDWKYESRRQAQQIIPHLFLGPLSAAKDVAFLKSHNITQLLAIRSTMGAYSRLLNQPPPPGVLHRCVDIVSQHTFIGKFQEAQQWIDEHYLSTLPVEVRGVFTGPLDGRVLPGFRKKWRETRGNELPEGGKTLVFCESGNERSAAVVAAYIMQYLAGTAIQAIQMVQGRRFCVCFDDQTKWMLMSYEPIWMARKQALTGVPNGKQVRSGGKRRFVDEDEEEEGGVGQGKGGGRAPFADDEEHRGDFMMG